MVKGLPDGSLTEQIIAAAIAVHRELGPGFLESVYEEALCIQFLEHAIDDQESRERRSQRSGHAVVIT